MNVLFTTGIKFTFEEYRLFNETIIKRRKLYLIIYGAAGIVLLMTVLCALSGGDIWEVCSVCLPTIIVLCGWGPVMNISMKNAWKNSGECDDIWYYGFFEDCMEQTTRKGSTKVYYDQMYEMIETDTHFYPMIGKNNGFIIRKENCRPELIAFLHGKANELKSRKA